MAKPLYSTSSLLPLILCHPGGFLDEFREGPAQQIPPIPCAPSLHWQRCELCPHKDGALKRTDNGGEGALNAC